MKQDNGFDNAFGEFLESNEAAPHHNEGMCVHVLVVSRAPCISTEYL